MQYTATLSVSAAGVCTLVGTWDPAAGLAGSGGSFECELKPPKPTSSTGPELSGLFLGEAAPDASLQDSVPRNPIKWVLAELWAPTVGATHCLVQ